MRSRRLVLLLLVPLAVGALLLLGRGAHGQLLGIIDLDTTPADLTVYGDDVDDWSGMAVAAGDINGDGIDDLLIGAALADPPGRTGAGVTNRLLPERSCCSRGCQTTPEMKG